MNLKQRVVFFKDLWPAACKTQHWGTGDDIKRHEVIATCMQLVGGPVTGSTKDLGDNEITALFCYLEFLAEESLVSSQRWLDCQQDYVAWNRARQADWHERAMYGSRSRPNKLDSRRFGGATSAVNDPVDEFDPKAAMQRHLTMATRHQKKVRAVDRLATAEAADVEAEMHFAGSNGDPF